MKKILITWIIISVLLVGGLTYIGMNLKIKNKDYYEIEERLTEAAKDYYSQYAEKLPAKEGFITSNTLMESDFLSNLNYKNEKCTGYVKVTKTYLLHEYKSFIKCNDYTTKKYNEGNNA